MMYTGRPGLGANIYCDMKLHNHLLGDINSEMLAADALHIY